MDQQLKQRLIGVTIVVALVVIFVPMLFDKSDDKGKLSSSGIPAIPDEVLEKPLELPKSPEDLVPKQAEESQEGKEKAPVESGYKMVPLNDEPPPKPNAEAKPPLAEEDEESMERKGSGEEGIVETAVEPAKQVAGEDHPPGTALPPIHDLSAKPEAVKHLAEPKPAATPKKAMVSASKPQPAAEHRKVEAAPFAAKTEAAKPKLSANMRSTQALAIKPDPAKSAEVHRATIKTVKAARPKPAAPVVADAADEEEPSAAPAKAETPVAKPKPVAAGPAIKPAVKKTELPKAAEPGHLLMAKEESPESAVAPPQAKPAPHPAKAKVGKPPVKKPSPWVVQAGSFTDEALARGLAEKLKQSKFPASVKAVHGEHGPVYRVQVGAEHDRGRAEETLRQIEGSVGINGIITQRH